MVMIITRIRNAGLFLSLFALAGCGSVIQTPIEDWQTYTNQKHNFSIQVPSGWKFKEIGVSDHEEVWFAAREFPPINTDARPDVLFIITEANPSAQWAPEYFDDYRSEIVRTGGGSVTKIAGVNKESLYEEIVFIMKVNEVYIQMFPGKSTEANAFFERILTSLEPAPEAISIPDSSTADICISPYFDPVAFLPEEEKILLRADSGVSVFDLKTYSKEIVIESPKQVVKAALSPDGNLVAWALEDHAVELFELSNGKVLSKFDGHSGFITSIKFSTKGDRIYTSSHDNTVRVWNVDGSLVSEIFPGGGEVLGIGISPDDAKLAIVTFDAPQKLWDLNTDELIEEIGSFGAFDGADAVFSADGSKLGVSLGSGPVSLWEAETGSQLWSGGDYALALSPDGRNFAYSESDANGDHLIAIRSLNGLELIRDLRGDGMLVWKIVISRDGSRLASAGGNGIRIWQVNNGELLYTLRSNCP